MVCSTQVKDIKESGKTLTTAYSRLVDYLSGYQMFYQNKTKKFFESAEQYTQGMLQTHRCNIEAWNKDENLIEKRLLVVRKIKTKSGYDIKYSYTNADLA